MFLKRSMIFSVILIMMLAFTVNVFAGTTGKITGRVIDKQTKEGLPGVNVIIPELQIGASTDADGYFFILNVPVGTYSVQASMITYASVNNEGVIVNADINTTVNFELLPEAIQLEEITVVAKRKLVETKTTAKERTIDQQFLEEMSGSGIMEVVATNAGVSGDGNELHVRGGRTDEVGYMVDGMSIVDPVFKTIGATINKNAVAEIKVITGGFNAEYGEAMSGVINVVTKEGGRSINGQLKYEGNSFLPEALNYGKNVMEVGLGGPIGTDKIRFFLSGDVYTANDYAPGFHETPEYFYKNDSTGNAFTWDMIQGYTIDWSDSLNTYVVSPVTAESTWTQDYVPFFTLQTTEVTFDTILYDSSGNPHTVTYFDTVDIPVIDTVLMNKYGPTYWDDLGIALPHHKRSDYHAQAKFTIKPTNNIKINIGGFLSHSSYQHYDNLVKYNLEQYYSRNTDGYQLNANLNWMLNEANFLTLTGSYFFTQTILAPEILDETTRITTSIPEWYEFWAPYDLMDTIQFKEVPTTKDQWKHNTPWGYWYAGNTRANYVYPNYYGRMTERYSNYWAVKGDWTSQIGRYHELKTGFEFKQYELYQWDLYLPWDPNPFWDNYSVKPTQASVYAQDKMEFEGMVVNLGLRFDYLASNTPYFVDKSDVSQPLYAIDTTYVIDEVSGDTIDTTYVRYINDTPPDEIALRDDDGNVVTDSLTGDTVMTAWPEDSVWNVQIAEPKYKLSPRLGISHPITETSVLHFNYGHFFQTPQMDYLYSGIEVDIRNRGNSLVGNPNLEAERTVAYEVGIATQIGADMAIDFTTYYKDIYGLVGSRKINALPMNYYAFSNVEYGNVKGFEITFQKNGKYFSTNIAYTLSFAKGTASDAWEGYETSYYYTDPVTGADMDMPKIPYYLSFDQRHLLNIVATFRMPSGELPVWADNWNITLNNAIASGTPYTPENLRGEITGTKNSERLPWSFNTDMKFRKGFDLGFIQPNFYINVSNLFNIKNVVDVYVTTGLPDTDGLTETWNVNSYTESNIGDPVYDVRRDLDKDGTVTSEEWYTVAVAAYEDQLNDPFNYSTPRVVTIGLEFSF